MHNQFPETADIETASDDYASRFAGPVGAWLLCVQETIALNLLKQEGATTVLDVGGGHGQLAFPLCRDGFNVTVLGSSNECRSRINTLVESGKCSFVVGNVINLPFEPAAFDSVICFRLVTHCARWNELVKELCRVARRSVIIDYPTKQSVNRIAPALFKAKKRIEGNTRTWKLFRHDEIHQEFARHGFTPSGGTGQFFLPMVLHRVLKCPRISKVIEGVCGRVGLSSRWGSPVIIKMSRTGDGV